MDSTDAVASLATKDIAARAAGARALSLVGTVEHLELLAGVAGGDPSPGVRLSAAAAAADILSRVRFGAARDALNEDQRSVFLDLYRKVDPALNPGVFPVFACLDCAGSFQVIAGGLRDPRGDIRLGAAVGLMRLCSSAAVVGNEALEEQVVSLLADTRHKPDAIAQIARVCAAVGYRSAIEIIRCLQLTGKHAEVVHESLGILDGASHPLSGVWFSDGRDAGETNPDSPMGFALMGFKDRDAVLHEGKGWKSKRFPKDVRRMFIRRPGEAEAKPAFQFGGRTFYWGLGQAVEALCKPNWSELSASPSSKASDIAMDLIGSQLEENAESHRALAILAADSGQVEVAQAALSSAISGKKTPADCWLFLADMLWEGDPSTAKGHYAAYLKKAKKKDGPEDFERAKERSS